MKSTNRQRITRVAILGLLALAVFQPLAGRAADWLVDPLKNPLQHYETRLADLFGAGMQACYRGPRLFDSDKTEAGVKITARGRVWLTVSAPNSK